MGLYLGIDVGTQSMKCVVLDSVKGMVAAESSVHFGRDLPEYDSPNGFLRNCDPRVRHADPRMWADALELALEHLAATGVAMSEIRGISGSGQQHGSVYLNQALGPWRSGERISDQLRPLLSRRSSPLWLDRSTSRECQELEDYFGDRMRAETGSPAIERFTGPQIRRFAKESPEAYARTVRIHLVSSFLCSLLCGEDAPVDCGDGAGMNLLNLKTLQWDSEIADFTAPDLSRKLPRAVPSSEIAGSLDPYFEKYGFSGGIPVAVWTGDNPSSLIGIGAFRPGTAGISLGTSDTFFAAMPDFRTDPDGCGHVFGNPAGGFMCLTCFTNGSLAREQIRDACHVSWDFFDREACLESEAGNGGRLILPYFEPESTPLVLTPGVFRNYENASPAEEIRAVFESQALSMRLHSEWMNSNIRRIRLTGGASGSSGFRRILADVFQARVETISVANSAALGAAMRAANSVDRIPLESLADQFCRSVEIVEPLEEHRILYDDMLRRFAALESERTLPSP